MNRRAIHNRIDTLTEDNRFIRDNDEKSHGRRHQACLFLLWKAYIKRQVQLACLQIFLRDLRY